MRAAVVAGMVLSVVTAISISLFGGPAAPGPDDGPDLDDIRASDLAAHLQFLSSDALEGRGPASRGGEQAAAYLAAHLARLGWAPAGDEGSFLQRVPLVESDVRAADLRADPSFALTHPDDIVLWTDRADARLEYAGDVVFVGFGIVAPEYDWNDYAGTDVRGKLVLALVGEPPTASGTGAFDGAALSYYGRWTYKIEEAARQGAAGVLLIHTDDSATYAWPVVQHSWTGRQFALAAPSGTLLPGFNGWVTERAARTLVARGGHALDDLRRAARNPAAATRALGVDVAVRLEQRIRPVVSANVVGVLRGSRPEEGVVYTAHYDHLGIAEPRLGEAVGTDRIFNGAVDNASGVAGLLEVAGALARAPRPRRSIYVVFTTAEESGLAGAVHFVRRSPIPTDGIVAAINLDVLNLAGRTRDVVLIGSERSTLGVAAAALARRQGRILGPDTDPGGGAYFRSDHFPFAAAGVPAVALGVPSLFAAHADRTRRAQAHWLTSRYHQPDDEFRADFDYTGAIDDLRLVAMLGWSVAIDAVRPVHRAGQPFGHASLGLTP